MAEEIIAKIKPLLLVLRARFMYLIAVLRYFFS
jgi:hypothetical protein